MPTNYTRTVAWTGANSGAGANYTWIDVSNAEAAGWITRVEDPNTADAWVFQIADNTASNAVLRTAVYRVQHYTYSDGADANTFDEFTITQHTGGTVTVTTNATTQATAATTPATGATAATTLATAATTPATGATAATTLATAATTPATGATAATTLATAATTPATGATAATTLATAATTLATAATTQATAATTLIPKTITWNGNSASPADTGFALLKFVTIDSGSGSGQTLVVNETSSGAGAGRLYWSSDASGGTAIAGPSWARVDGTPSAFGTGSGVSDPETARVVVTVDAYPALTTTTTSSGSGGGIGIR